MDETILTVRIPRYLVEKAKQFASQNHTTLTNLIEAYLQGIPNQPGVIDAPIVCWLSGTLSPNATIEDYHKHVELK